MRRDERVRAQASAGAGMGEWAPEEAAGRVGAGERGHPGCTAKRVVAAPARRGRLRQMIGGV